MLTQNVLEKLRENYITPRKLQRCVTTHVKLLRQRQSSAVAETRQIVTSTTKERSPRKSNKSCPPPETVPYAVKRLSVIAYH